MHERDEPAAGPHGIRQGEFALRTALGATPAELARGPLTEALLLAAAGGMLGLVLARWAVDVVLATIGGGLPRVGEIGLDPAVFAFAILLAFAAAVGVGLLPALRASRSNLADSLRTAGRGQAGGRSRTRSALVAAEVAMTIVLLVGGSLLARSFGRMLEVDLGFQTGNRIALETIQPFPAGDGEARRLGDLHRTFEERARTLPGVLGLGGVSAPPLTGRGGNGRFLIEGTGSSEDYWPNFRVASPGYFEVLGIPLLEGRLFSPGDGPAAPGVALISETVARTVWPGQSPLGRRIHFGNMDGVDQFMTIVGVVGDVRHRGPVNPVRGEIYFSYLQRPGGTARFTWFVETGGDPAAAAPSLAALVRELAPELPIHLRTMDQMFSESVSDRLFNLWLLAAFSGVALVLAVMGIYGLIAYSVAQRTAEIGVRTALGARPGQVVGLFVREGARLVAVGVAAGLLGALIASRLLESLLFNVAPTDPVAFLAGVVALTAPALVASYLSARRAARVNPIRAIQSQ